MLSLYLSMVANEEDKNRILYIYENYYSFMYHCAVRVVGSESPDIEDIVHDAMLKLIDMVDGIDFSDPVRVKNFCGVMARRIAIDRSRKKKSLVMWKEDEPVLPECSDLSVEDIIVDNESIELMMKLIGQTGEIYKEILFLRYINELNETKIADILGMPETTVHSRLNHGKNILKELLRKEKQYE